MIGDCEAPETCSDGQADICGRSKQDESLAVVEDEAAEPATANKVWEWDLLVERARKRKREGSGGGEQREQRKCCCLAQTLSESRLEDLASEEGDYWLGGE